MGISSCAEVSPYPELVEFEIRLSRFGLRLGGFRTQLQPNPRLPDHSQRRLVSPFEAWTQFAPILSIEFEIAKKSLGGCGVLSRSCGLNSVV